MKPNKGLRQKENGSRPDDAIRKAVKLDPIKKSGKERHMMYSSLEDEDDYTEITDYREKESVLDYFDDGEEEYL